jgi:uncharacterized membrane protein
VRYPWIDFARGIAILLMFVYHFCYDLVLFRWLYFDFQNSPFWLSLRTLIVSLFLLLVGISLFVATENGLNVRRFSRRLGWLVVCAALVSVASYGLFGSRFIYFGILHFIALASVLALWLRHFYRLNLFLGAALIVLGQVKWATFDSAWLNWLGFAPRKPATEDYVPLLPWLGAVCIGLFLGRFLLKHPQILCWQQAKIAQTLVTRLGQHSLLIYMLHQPLLLGLCYAVYGFLA